MPITRPMLAIPLEDTTTITYPVLATPKLDGIRVLIVNKTPVSRNFKVLRNKFLASELSKLPEGLDGELMAGDNFQECTSAIMSFDGEPDVKYYVFDYVDGNNLSEPYEDRMKKLAALTITDSRVVKLLPIRINSEQELLAYEQKCLDEGFEGVILRSPKSPYKCGRSTAREAYMFKLKRFQDAEAVITGFEAKTVNQNPSVVNALGLLEKSTKKENLVEVDTLGTLLASDLAHGYTLRIGSGLDDALRKTIWTNQSNYVGKVIKYKYFNYNVKDLPRFPIFVGFRDLADMDVENGEKIDQGINTSQ